MKFSSYFVVLGFSLVLNVGLCTDKRLLTLNQDDVDRRLAKLESLFATCNASISKAQERISTLEGKVNNSIHHMVAFTACHSKGSTIGVLQTVIYDHIITNIGNDYDVRDGEFNVPYDGIYTFSVTGMAYSDSDMYLNLLKNGMFVQRMYSNSGYADSSAFTTNLYLQAGDKIWVVNGGYGSDHLHPGNYNFFSGMLSKEKY